MEGQRQGLYPATIFRVKNWRRGNEVTPQQVQHAQCKGQRSYPATPFGANLFTPQHGSEKKFPSLRKIDSTIFSSWEKYPVQPAFFLQSLEEERVRHTHRVLPFPIFLLPDFQ